MDNLTVRALSEEMAYMKGYADALAETNGKRRKKQEQQKKKSEHRAKVAAGIMCGTTLLVLSGIVGLIDKDATFCVFVVMIETLIAWNICRDFIKRIRRSRKNGNERQGNKR